MRRRDEEGIGDGDRATTHLDLGLRKPPGQNRELVRPAAGVGALQQAPIRVRDLEAAHFCSDEVGHNDCGHVEHHKTRSQNIMDERPLLWGH